MLYGKILHCPHPRARIIEARYGTGRSPSRGKGRSDPGKHRRAGARYWYEVSEPAFPEVLTHEGQEVAAVAAEDRAHGPESPGAHRGGVRGAAPRDATPNRRSEEPAPCRLLADEEYPGRELFDRKPFVIQRGDIDKGIRRSRRRHRRNLHHADPVPLHDSDPGLRRLLGRAEPDRVGCGAGGLEFEAGVRQVARPRSGQGCGSSSSIWAADSVQKPGLTGSATTPRSSR